VPARAWFGLPALSSTRTFAAVIGRDVAKAVRLFLHARIRAVELQQEHRALRQVRFRIKIQCAYLHVIEQFNACGMPVWIVAMTASQAALTEWNWHTPAEIASGMPCSLKVILRAMPSVPSAPMNNFLVGGDLLGVLLEVRNDSVDREVDTALQVNRVHAGATAFAPSRTIAAASTVGVVVPSPPASALRLGFDCGVAVRPQCDR
jgi:hypothetical protein